MVTAGLIDDTDDYELHFMRANALKDLSNLDLALEVRVYTPLVSFFLLV